MRCKASSRGQVKEKRCKTHGKRNTTRVSRIQKGKIHRDKTPKQALAKKRIKPKALRVLVVEFARAVRCPNYYFLNQGISLTSHTNVASGKRSSPPPRRRRSSSTSLSGRNSQEKKATKRKKRKVSNSNGSNKTKDP